ncbi:MAG TPA: undecaprenyl-diphosphate phosphatase [Actinomycetota bacterium]|nr:undecaprenyl-diphosphate phosphatase [Actinomycetota bacterium]
MLRAAVLGAVQGLTEFIPISSSAHLVLVPFLLGWAVPGLAFDVAVHIGTAVAVVVYFWRDIGRILLGATRTVLGRGDAGDRTFARLLLLLALASIPAAIAGFFLENTFESLFTTSGDVRRIGALAVGLFLLVTAALILVAEWAYARRERATSPRDVGTADAVVVGLLQATAIAPGISRSGATISGGMLRGLTREAAARFSFLLSLPAIIGAAIISLPDLPANADLGPMLVGTGTSAVTGFAAIAFLLRYLRTRTMRPFAIYCLLLAAVAIGYWFQVK